MNSEKIIFVYADWKDRPVLMGKLYVSNLRGKENFSFEYSKEWLKNEKTITILDPDLSMFEGRQYVPQGKSLFGIFSDSCPDRWGRLLMERRENIQARKEDRKPKKLLDSDFLLGVYDESRMGALRFSLEENGPFLSTDEKLSTPPMANLRKLETASIAFENDETGLEEKWLNQLLNPGSSLGGARPKASVIAPDGSLWIAKFPSKNDEYDSGAWEKVVHDLAMMCGIHVPEAKMEKLSENGSTFLVKRFDREESRRIHFTSTMTLLGKEDGAENVSYLDIASFIKMNGAYPQQDLKELWKRIVFSIAVSNSDDHLRNHGFLLTTKGWKLSPAYDINPNIYGDTLSLNISKTDNSMKFGLAIETAKFYRIDEADAKEQIEQIKYTVEHNWEEIAKKYHLSRNAIEYMSPAFNMKYK